MAGRFYPVTSLSEADALRRRLLDLAESDGRPAMVGVSHVGVARGPSFATAVVRLCAVLPDGVDGADENLLDRLGVMAIDEAAAEIDHVSDGAAGLHRLFGNAPPGASWSPAEDWLLRRWNRGALAHRAGRPADAIERAEKLAGTPVGLVAEPLGGILTEPGAPTIAFLRKIAAAPGMPSSMAAGAALLLDLMPAPSERIRPVDAAALARKSPAAYRGACMAALERIARDRPASRSARQRLAQSAAIIRRSLSDDAALAHIEVAVWKLRAVPVIVSAAQTVCDGAAASALEDRKTSALVRSLARDPALASAGFLRERALEGAAVLLALRHRSGGLLTLRIGEGALRYGFDGKHGDGLSSSLSTALAVASGEDLDAAGNA